MKRHRQANLSIHIAHTFLAKLPLYYLRVVVIFWFLSFKFDSFTVRRSVRASLTTQQFYTWYFNDVSLWLKCWKMNVSDDSEIPSNHMLCMLKNQNSMHKMIVHCIRILGLFLVQLKTHSYQIKFCIAKSVQSQLGVYIVRFNWYELRIDECIH